MRTLIQDLRFGFRSFWSSPGFTVVTVLTLGLGIAFNTTVFGWVNGLLLRPYPGAADQERLAILGMSTEGAPNGGDQLSFIDYLDYRANLKSLAGLAVHREEVFTLGTALNAQPVWGELVSGNYFDVLGVRMAAGRAITPEDDRLPGGHPEGYLEAFANLYRDVAAVLRGGIAPALQGIGEGVRSMAFIDTAVRASRAQSGWVDFDGR